MTAAIGNAASPYEDCDKIADGRLTEDEIRECLLRTDSRIKNSVEAGRKAEKDASDYAKELAGEKGFSTFEEAEKWWRQHEDNLAEPAEMRFGWAKLRIGRKLTDNVDPRKKGYPAAFVLSYTDDREGKNDAFVALGDITWYTWSITRDGDEDTTSLSLKSSFDLTSAKAVSESTVSLSVPLSKVWEYSSSWLTSFGASIEPKYITDREGRRDVVQLAVSFSPSSQRLNAGGYGISIGTLSPGFADVYRLFWKPTLTFEYGDVRDAEGVAALEAMKALGAYKRVAPAVEISLKWPRPKMLTWNTTYTYRHDIEANWEREFFTSGFQYDVAKNISLTLTYRKGRKPDTFEKIEDILFGVGLTRSVD